MLNLGLKTINLRVKLIFWQPKQLQLKTADIIRVNSDNKVNLAVWHAKVYGLPGKMVWQIIWPTGQLKKHQKFVWHFCPCFNMTYGNLKMDAHEHKSMCFLWVCCVCLWVFAGPLSPRIKSMDYSARRHFINCNLTSEVPHISTRRKNRDTICQVCHTGST